MLPMQWLLDQARRFFQAAANEPILWYPYICDDDYGSRKQAGLERIAAKLQISREIVELKFHQLQRTFLIVEPTIHFCGWDVTDIPQEDEVQQEEDEDLVSDTEPHQNPGSDGQVLNKIIEEGMKKDDNPTWPDLLVSYVRMMIQNAGNRPEAEMRRLQKTLIGVMENFQDGGMAAP